MRPPRPPIGVALLPDGRYALTSRGAVAAQDIASHSTSPTLVDWNRDGVLDLLVGAEDGFLYYARRETND